MTLHSGLCRIDDGALIEPVEGLGARALEALAQRVPSLLGDDTPSPSQLLSGRLKNARGVSFRQLLLVDDRWFYIVQRLARGDAAFVAVAGRERNLAMVVSEARERARGLDLLGAP